MRSVGQGEHGADATIRAHNVTVFNLVSYRESLPSGSLEQASIRRLHHSIYLDLLPEIPESVHSHKHNQHEHSGHSNDRKPSPSPRETHLVLHTFGSTCSFQTYFRLQIRPDPVDVCFELFFGDPAVFAQNPIQ